MWSDDLCGAVGKGAARGYHPTASHNYTTHIASAYVLSLSMTHHRRSIPGKGRGEREPGERWSPLRAAPTPCLSRAARCPALSSFLRVVRLFRTFLSNKSKYFYVDVRLYALGRLRYGTM